jgi:hypothetical protein
MSLTRLASASVVAVAVALSGATAGAQFGNLLKKVPKPPGAPGPAAPAPAALYCSGITDDLINRYLKAKSVQKATIGSEMAKANALKAKADALKAKSDALGQQRGQAQVSAMMKNMDCTDAFKEKDPRTKEIARLDGLAEAATNSGNDAKAADYSRQSSQLGEALELDADRSCGGHGFAALYDCREQKEKADPRSAERDKLRRMVADAAAKGDSGKQGQYAQQADQLDAMVKVDAQMACMQNPATMGVAGARSDSAEETAAKADEAAATQAAADAMRNAQANADKAGRDAAGLTDNQFNMLDHCIRGVLAGNAGTPVTDDSKAAIMARAGDLGPAVK